MYIYNKNYNFLFRTYRPHGLPQRKFICIHQNRKRIDIRIFIFENNTNKLENIKCNFDIHEKSEILYIVSNSAGKSIKKKRNAII